MNPKKNIPKAIPPNPENPFKVPEGYFDDVQKKVMERIRSEEQSAEEKSTLQFHGTDRTTTSASTGKQQSEGPSGGDTSRKRKIYLQPYLTLAAAITGVALVVYILLQTVIGSRSGDAIYDIATLDMAGVIQDESVLAETYAAEEEEDTYSEWDEEAMVYLASNEVDLLNLLETN